MSLRVTDNAQPYIHENYMKTWRQLEKLVDQGLVRHIGTSNMTIPKLKLLLRDARIKPAANEMELHPHFQQPELFDFVRANGIEAIGYSPIGSPGAAGARSHGRRYGGHRGSGDRARSPNGWAFTRPWSASSGRCSAGRRRFPSRPSGATIWPISRPRSPTPLTAADMAAIAGIDKNCRLIKGQVFLWKADQDWEDLWDIDGEMT